MGTLRITLMTGEVATTSHSWAAVVREMKRSSKRRLGVDEILLLRMEEMKG